MYNKNQIKGIILLIILMCITLISKYLKNRQTNVISDINISNIEIVPVSQVKYDSTNIGFKSKHIKIKTNIKKIKPRKKPIITKEKQSILFEFNPNKISYDSILMLGVNKQAANNWLKYIDKGGIFKSKSDLAKIYNLDQNTFNKIHDYILLPDTIIKSKQIAYKNTLKYQKQKKKENIIIDLNTCTAEDLKKLNGIGSVLSKRIIKYRNKLGGFYTVSQLKEVYGLPEETYKRIKNNLKINTEQIKKIKINLVRANDLASFPYINYRLAKQLINYRIQHGYFNSYKDLKNLKSLDLAKIKKLEPYIDFALR